MMAKNLFDVEIPISTACSMSHHMEKNRVADPKAKMAPNQWFRWHDSVPRENRVCLMTI